MLNIVTHIHTKQSFVSSIHLKFHTMAPHPERDLDLDPGGNYGGRCNRCKCICVNPTVAVGLQANLLI